MTEFSRYNVSIYIKKHQKTLQEEQEKFRLNLRDKINEDLQANFNEGHLFEIRVVKTYIKKGYEVLAALEELDLTAQDEDGNFVNRGQFITLMMILKEQQAMVGRLSQTDAAREYALFRRKAKVKTDAAVASGICEEAEVTFMDDDKATSFFGEKGARRIS